MSFWKENRVLPNEMKVGDLYYFNVDEWMGGYTAGWGLCQILEIGPEEIKTFIFGWEDSEDDGLIGMMEVRNFIREAYIEPVREKSEPQIDFFQMTKDAREFLELVWR